MRIALHTRIRSDRIAEYEGAHAEVPAARRDNPVNVAWQARMAGLLADVHDYSPDGAAASLPVVWQL